MNLTDKDILLIQKHLQKKSTPAEEEALESWLKTDQNQKHFKDIEKLWLNSERAFPAFEPDVEAAKIKFWQKVEDEGEAPVISIGQQDTTDKNGWIFLKIAASLLIIGVVGFLLWPASEKGMREFASADESLEVSLPDGSKVWLNKQSSLSYEAGFGENDRKVMLKGEAYFEVEHKPELPFKVINQNTKTEVLGTSFNVRGYEDLGSIEVSVLTGRVSFVENFTPGEAVILSKGNRVVYDKSDQSTETISSNNFNEIAWKTGVLIFENTPFADVIGTIEEYYNVKFEYSPDMIHCKLTNRFSNQPIDEVMDELALSFDLEYRQEEDTYFVDGEGCQSQ